MRILELIHHLDVVELDVEVLVDTLEDAADADVVFELDGHLVVDEGFEEAFQVNVSIRVIGYGMRVVWWSGMRGGSVFVMPYCCICLGHDGDSLDG